MGRVIAVDPGREKCGLAVFDGGRLAKKAVLPRAEILAAVVSLYQEGTVLVVGDRTGSRNFVSDLEQKSGIIDTDICLIDEHRSSEEARRRYWQDHPARGLRRLLPLGLQVPPVPVDDYVAEILGERYFASVSHRQKVNRC